MYTYNVTAGVGPFNGSYVGSYIQGLRDLAPDYKYQVVPYSNLAIVYNLVVNPMHSLVSPPINCKGNLCDSYLLTGGLVMTTPWPPTNYSEHPVVEVYKAPATQIDFERGLHQGDSFSNADCSVFGADGFLIGIQLCVAESHVASRSYMAGKCMDLACESRKSCRSIPIPGLSPGPSFFSTARGMWLRSAYCSSRSLCLPKRYSRWTVRVFDGHLA